MEHSYQDVVRGSPVERRPDRAAPDVALDTEETLPQHGAALIDYALRDWNAITQGSTASDGWVNRWFFDTYIVNFPPDFRGWAAVAEPEVSSLSAVSYMQDYSEATEYRLSDWARATDGATIGQHVRKHVFDTSIAQCNPRIRRFTNTSVLPLSPNPERQPASPARIHGPLSTRHSPIPSDYPSRESTSRPSRVDGLEFQRSRSTRSQQELERGSLRSRGNILDHDNAKEPSRRRTRSRSPNLIARPRLDRDRDYPGTRRQRDVSLQYSDGGTSSRGEPTRRPSEHGHYHEAPSGTAPTHAHDNEHSDEGHECIQGAGINANGTTENLSPEPGHVVPHGTGLPDPEFKQEKNEFSICCLCWTNNRPCDHQWPCRECKVRGIVCAYIVCPMSKCPLEVKCPAYHIVPGLGETRNVGSPMHLLALLGLNRRVIESYDKFEDPAARKLLKDSDKVPAMRDKTLRFKASMIAVLVRQLKAQPYKELWKQFHRQQKFGPTTRG
ncbi:hypothetical protein KCU65_g1955, partial [Aureobasidium melanogenum]